MRFFPKIIFGIKTKEKILALTFDDGPHPVFTLELLKLLAEFNVKATFFVSGKNVEQHKDIVKQIVANGHELGNHAYSHRNLIFKTTSFIRNEIEKTDDLIRSCGVDAPVIVRPPFGRFLISALYVFYKLKKKIILWNIPTKDYKATNSEQIISKVYRNLKPGGIIVMHDAGKDNSLVDRSISLQAVRILVNDLPIKGYRFVTIQELLSVN